MIEQKMTVLDYVMGITTLVAMLLTPVIGIVFIIRGRLIEGICILMCFVAVISKMWCISNKIKKQEKKGSK